MIAADEKQLLMSLKADDRSAIHTIFFRYHADLCRISYRVVNDEDEAKDIVQEVFLKLWRTRKTLDVQFSLYAYLKRAVLNTSFNYLDRTAKFSPWPTEHEDSILSPVNIVEQDHDFKELSQRIELALQNLPQRTRAVFMLIRFEGMSYKEVATHLNISEKAVEKEMMKALRSLRESLKEYLPWLLIPALFSMLK